MSSLLEEALLDSHEAQTIEKSSELTDKRTSHQWTILLCLFFGQFCSAACVSIQAPFFPKEAEKKGATPTEYGFVFGVFELAVIVSSPVFGKMMAHCTPQFLLFSGQFVAGVCVTLFGLLDKSPGGFTFIALAYAIRIVEGFGIAAYVTSAYTVVASEFPDRIGTISTSMGTFFGLGLIAGPSIGGLVYQIGGFFLPFAVMGVALLLGSCLSLILLPKRNFERSVRYMSEFLSVVGIKIDALAIVSSFTFAGFLSAALEPYLRQFSLVPSFIGLIFMINGVFYGITSPFYGWLCDKGANSKMLCLFGYLLECVSLLFLGPVSFISIQTSLWLIIVSLIIGGIGMGAKVSCAFISSIKGAQMYGFPNDVATHGLVSAVFATSCAIGGFIGPSLGGVLLQYIGFKHGTELLLSLDILLMLISFVHSAYYGMVRRRFLMTFEVENDADIIRS